MAQDRCDIIIPIYGNLPYVKDCLESIARHTGYPYRLILINNSSSGEVSGYLRRFEESKCADTVLIEP